MSTTAPIPTDTDPTDTDPAGPGAGLAAERVSLRDAARRLAEGDLASLRVVLVLVVIWTIFTIANDRFLTAVNLTNLALQIAAVGTISVGVVLVLLLGEIDLSVGAVSGLAAAVTATLSVKSGWSAWPAIFAGLAVGATIGLLQGTLSTRLGIPSFVVTLAGLLGWQGALLAVLGSEGTININDPGITNLAGTFFSDIVGWVVAAACIAAITSRPSAAAAGDSRPDSRSSPWRRSRYASGLPPSASSRRSRSSTPTAACRSRWSSSSAWSCSSRDSSPARRMASTCSRSAATPKRHGERGSTSRVCARSCSCSPRCWPRSAASSPPPACSPSTNPPASGDLLLLAIAGPVIAGVSLFGGRGSVWGALLGALVIGSISNGMDLLALESSVKFMVTGGVLLAAVALDAVGRQRRQAHGRL